MKLFFGSFSILILLSCNKAELNSSPRDILKTSAWGIERRYVQKFNSANQLIADSIIYYETCMANSTIRFSNDSLCFKKLNCFSPEKSGKWFLTNDSILSAKVLTEVYNGNGIAYENMGIDPGKLLQINSDSFILRRVDTLNLNRIIATFIYHRR